mmetsp:Transcript_69877/g.156763  ORF Transcript_69877/g.156763 Transcript_69877/m.156763 type:complete len:240 (+) Transcript_69877:233-952(+)
MHRCWPLLQKRLKPPLQALRRQVLAIRRSREFALRGLERGERSRSTCGAAGLVGRLVTVHGCLPLSPHLHLASSHRLVLILDGPNVLLAEAVQFVRGQPFEPHPIHAGQQVPLLIRVFLRALLPTLLRVHKWRPEQCVGVRDRTNAQELRLPEAEEAEGHPEKHFGAFVQHRVQDAVGLLRWQGVHEEAEEPIHRDRREVDTILHEVVVEPWQVYGRQGVKQSQVRAEAHHVAGVIVGR